MFTYLFFDGENSEKKFCTKNGSFILSGSGDPVTFDFDDQRFFVAKENSKRRSPESPIPYSASGERDKIYVISPSHLSSCQSFVESIKISAAT
jgi:hypothetical protein